MARLRIRKLLRRIREPLAIRLRKAASRSESERQAIRALRLIPKPTGIQLGCLMEALTQAGKRISPSTFDCLAILPGKKIDFSSPLKISHHLDRIFFVEVKTTSREDLRPDFRRFYFSVTENEVLAGQTLRERYLFCLFNTKTDASLLLTQNELAARIRKTWISHSVLLD